MFDRSGCPLPPQPLKWQGSAVSFDLHQDMAIDGVNVDRGTNQLILYTAAYGPTTLTNQYGSELVLKLENRNWLGDLGQAVQAVPLKLYHNRGNTLIRPGTVVLSAHGSQVAQLFKFWRTNRGHAVSLRLDTYPPVWNSLGAKPLLLLNGRYTGQWAEKEVNPITIFAWKPDCTRMMIAVDGRQDGSRGVTNQQAASLAASLGATTAFGLDGGGSTTLVGRGKVLNHPSDILNGRRVQRMVADSLLFVPPSRPKHTVAAPGKPARPVAVGQSTGLVINFGGVEHLPAAILEQLSPLGAEAGRPMRMTTGLAILLIGILVGLQAIHLRRRYFA